MTDLTHIFISGSHLWGLYNLGIIRYMQAYPDYFTKIKDIGGVSFGAITAYFIILNIDIARIEKLFYKLVETEEFKLIPYDKLINIIYEKGVQDVSIYFDIFEEELSEFKGLTFADISKKYGKNLHILAQCVSTGELTLFNTDNTPNVVVINTIKASSSVPIASPPVEIDGYLYCDGCITSNTLLEYFPDIPKNQILSIIHKFNTSVKQYAKGHKLTNFEYFNNLLYIYYRKQNYVSTSNHINDNTLVINNHDSLITTTTNEEGFYVNIDTKTVDYALMHGFKIMVDWMEKHYKDKITNI